MIGRQSVWSNERVIELTKNFVATTDEVWRLQQADDPEALYFQKLAVNGHYHGAKSRTQQGIYIFTPAGKLLGSINSNRPEYVLRLMQQGLRNWNDLPAEQRDLDDESLVEAKHRWEDGFQSDGLDLTMYVRDLNFNGPQSSREDKWNQDRVWFSKREALQWLPESFEETRDGEKYMLPRSLALRFARLHLLDIVKGQTSDFEEGHVTYADIEVTVESIEQSVVKVSISGATRAESRYEWGERKAYVHGVATKILGHATFDISREKFVEFEMVAIGKRWGRTSFNERKSDGPSNPIGYVFRLTDAEAPIVAPAYLRAYGADWVKRPE